MSDFLSRPEELVFWPKGKKVTRTLCDESIAYFKTQTDPLGTTYQRMIRHLLDEYVRQMQRTDLDLARKWSPPDHPLADGYSCWCCVGQ